MSKSQSQSQSQSSIESTKPPHVLTHGKGSARAKGLSALSAGTVSRTVCDRISSGHTNAGKKAALADHFTLVMGIKNALSEFLMEYWMRWSDADFTTRAEKIFAHRLRHMQRETPTGSDPHPYTSVLSAWEFQKTYRDIVFPQTRLAFDITFKHSKLVVRKPIDWSVYNAHKRYRKSHAKSDLKSTLNEVRSAVLYGWMPLPDTIPPAVQDSWRHYCEKYGEARLLALLECNRQNFLNRLKAPVFTTGTYIKAAQFNKRSVKPVWHSYWKRDESNQMYQDWYQFKSPQFADHDNSAVYLPLVVDYGYHTKDYDLRKEHYVSLNSKGEINIGLAYTDEVILPDFQKVIGIDANIVSNQLADSAGRMVTMDGGQWSTKALPVFEKHEAKGTKNLTHQELRTQQRLNAERDCLIRKMIGESLRFYKEQGITDLIVEQLTFHLGSVGSTLWNKMIRRFRLSTLKRWFREQAHKMGMRVHDLPSAFSSQACECGHVSASNRKKQPVFLCTECGASHNADTHAAENIERLFKYARDVLLQKGWVTVNEYGEYCATQKAYHQYSLLKEVYQNLPHAVFNAA